MEFIKELNGGFSVIENLKVSGAREGKYGVTIIGIIPDLVMASKLDNAYGYGYGKEKKR